MREGYRRSRTKKEIEMKDKEWRKEIDEIRRVYQNTVYRRGEGRYPIEDVTGRE